MQEECLICKAPLTYLEQDERMECAICHKQERSKTRCVEGHYVCSDCHTQGMDSIFGLCLSETSRDPIVILEKMMSMPFCHMHGPEHHVMVGAALLTAYRNGCQGRRGDGMTRAYGSAPQPIRLRADDSAAEPCVLTHPGCLATSVCNQHPLFSVSLSGFLPTFPSGSEPPTEAQHHCSRCLPGHTWTSTSLSVLDNLAGCLEILPSDSGLLC